MFNQQSQRVAPLIALLVIVFSLIILLTVGVLRQQATLSNNDNSVPTSTAVPMSAVTPTAIPVSPSDSSSQTRYDAHINKNQLYMALYQLEAEANRTEWTAQDHIRAGNLWRDMGDLGRALPHWEAANTDEPNANLLRQIAAIYLERGDWSIAWQRIQTLITLTPNNAWALYHAGLILAPSDPATAFGYLGRVAALNNEFSDTAQQVIDAIGDTQNDSDIILRIGTQLASAEEWSLAENAYQYAADVYYPFPDATAYVALMRILQGKNGEAQLSEALALDNTNADIHYIAGVYWRAAGEFIRSEDALIQAIILAPDNPTFHAELGITYREMGNMLDAEVWLQTAVILSENNPIFVNTLERFYQDEAFTQAQAVIGIQPIPDLQSDDDPEALSARGWASHIRGDSAEGLSLVERALSLDPTNPRALFDKARILIETDLISEAVPLLQELANGQSVFAGVAQGLLEREQ